MSTKDDNSAPWDESDEQVEVLDDDGDVDRKVKDRILKSREYVDSAEAALFVDKYDDLLDRAGRRMSPEQVKHILAERWSVVVRQYIRTVRPLLTSDEIEQAQYYWEELPVYSDTIEPPAQNGIDWPRFYRSDESDYAIAKSMEMNVDMSFEAPEPKPVELNGLRDVLQFQEQPLYWTVVYNPDSLPIQQESETLEAQLSLPKGVYEAAVEYTDEFLQEIGIGLEIGTGDPHGKT